MKVIVLYEKSWENESPSLFIINLLDNTLSHSKG